MNILRHFILFNIVLVSFFNCYGQFDGAIPGCAATNRNFPVFEYSKDSSIIQCRKLSTQPKIYDVPMGFNYELNSEDTTGNYFSKNVSLITNYVWQKRDINLLHFVYEFAVHDSFKHGEQYYAIWCLGSFNTKKTKEFLLKLLDKPDKTLVLYSALSLVQLGIFDISFPIIVKYYKNKDIHDDVHTALMLINSPESIEFLKQLSNDPDPSNALDALGALSLMGYCDFAFKGFSRYVNSDIWQVREKVTRCLAYYIGTPEAFKIIKNMQNDDDQQVREDAELILKFYKIKN